jgi:putative ABC transport system permease protein
MLLNYLRIALRQLGRQRLYAAISISGLAVGIAVSLLILLFVVDERSFDSFQENADRIFRVTLVQAPVGGSTSVEEVLLSPALAPAIRDGFPEIEYIARLTPVGPSVRNNDRVVTPEHFFYTDPEIFDILSIRVLAGRPEQALTEPMTISISESIGRKLFGNADPLNQIVTVGDGEQFQIVGVFEDTPDQSHIHFDVLGSLSTVKKWFPQSLDVWDSPNYLTYIRVSASTDVPSLKKRLRTFLSGLEGQKVPHGANIRLQNIRDIHLNSTVMAELEAQGDSSTILILSAIALLILLIATINFANMAVAASVGREREIGVRKAAGASRSQLIVQFLGEAVLTTILAATLGLILVQISLPSFNAYVGKNLGFDSLDRNTVAGLFLLGIPIISVLAGGYPALILSGFRPVQIFRGSLARRSKTRFRSALVVFQFAVATTLVLATVVVKEQLSFVETQELGYNVENVLVLPPIPSIADDFEPFRDQLLQNPDIIEVSQSNRAPFGGVIPPFSATAYHASATQTASLYPMWIDDHYFDTYDIKISSGRDLDLTRPSDVEAGLVLNETAAKALGWDRPADAVGETVGYGGARRSVVGIASDFHQESLQKAVVPMGFYTDNRNYRVISVRFRTTNFTALLSFLDVNWNRYQRNQPLSYELLDQRIRGAYNQEKRLGQLFGAFSILGIFIACLGLFGVSAISVSGRRKEMGIRKAVGATTVGLVSSIASQFIRLALIALIIGGGVGYSLMIRWLNQFAYHFTIGPMIGLIVAGVIFLTSTTAVLYASITAAHVSPVESLRYE